MRGWLRWTMLSAGLFMLIAMGMAVAVVAALIGSPEAVTGIMFPLAMLMAAMFFVSIYFSFKDCFEVSPEETI